MKNLTFLREISADRGVNEERRQLTDGNELSVVVLKLCYQFAVARLPALPANFELDQVFVPQ